MNNNPLRNKIPSRILNGMAILLFLTSSLVKSAVSFQPQTIAIPVRNPFVKILPPDCRLPIEDLLAIESIGVIHHQIELDLLSSEFANPFHLWFIPTDGIWQMQQVGDEFIGEWFIDGIDHQHINLRYEGELDSRCEDLPTLRQHQLIF